MVLPSNPQVNEFQKLLNNCPTVNLNTLAQLCRINFGEAARILTIPSSLINTNDPFAGADEAEKLLALGTQANWLAALNTPLLPEAKAYISPAPPFNAKGQEKPATKRTVGNLPNGDPVIQRGGEFEIFTLNFYELSAANEIALTALTGTTQHFIIIDKYGIVIAKDVTDSDESHTFFFKATMINVSERSVTNENDPLGDLIQADFMVSLGELKSWRRYEEAQAFSLTILPT